MHINVFVNLPFDCSQFNVFIKLYRFIVVPIGYPQEVSVHRITSQSAELSWNPPLPEERNGILTSYIVTVTRQGSDIQLQLMSVATNITISMLDSFTTYFAAVAASTSIGIGPPTTQFSFTIIKDS